MQLTFFGFFEKKKKTVSLTDIVQAEPLTGWAHYSHLTQLDADRDNIVMLNLQAIAFCGTWSMQALGDCLYIDKTFCRRWRYVFI